MLARTLLVLALAATASAEITWVNDYDEPFTFECPVNEVIFHISSIHDNDSEDRLWGYDCRNSTEIFDSCSWSGYVNDFDEVLLYECNHGAGVITGIHSEHENEHEDRRWDFKCCSQENTCYKECSWTPYVNDFDGVLDYEVQEGYFIQGMESEHDNKHEDRIWRYHLCQIVPC